LGTGARKFDAWEISHTVPLQQFFCFYSIHFLLRDARISAAYAVMRCLPVTFVYCVETVKDKAIVAMECE